jgi:RHS repeat-associated protein
MNKSGVASQVIAHPKGGGAVSGIGETFQPDLHTGTGNLTVPIACPPGRNGFAPDFAMVYSTGGGNGHFGLGWSLSIPHVSRRTDKGVPRYDRRDEFVLSGSEPLIQVGGDAASVRYRPRTENSFANIIHRTSDVDDFWEVRSRSGLVSHYGTAGRRGADQAVVRAPDDPRKVFEWRLTLTTDPFGNRIEYDYEREECAFDGAHGCDQIRLRTIRYGDFGDAAQPQFLICITFYYEPRPDAFSVRRSGFEVRTGSRCRGIEIATHAGEMALTARRYRLIYADNSHRVVANGASLLRRIVVEGVDGDTIETLPPLDFAYTDFTPQKRIYRSLRVRGGAAPMRSLGHADFELADVNGDGLPDIVEIGRAARYWRNLGDGRFDVPRPFTHLPQGVRLGDSGVLLADANGDGQIDLIISNRTWNGHAPLTAERPDGERFVAQPLRPSFLFEDPEVRIIDLDGDGVPDVLRSGESFELYFQDPKSGWVRAETRKRRDIASFPDVRFSDPRVKIADMTGDGLQDIVLVNAGGVDYWPYLGHGRWGRRISMRGRIQFPDAALMGGIGFDPKRVLLGDVDGDGVADLVYVESGRVTVWINQSGSGWGDPIVVRGTPRFSDVDAVRLADILGIGTDGILWSYDFDDVADGGLKFLDLTGGIKPYVLNARDNNSGARTLVEYASSTRFFVEDDAEPATRWRGRLPFPVQVVAKVTTLDAISGGALTSEYAYHQGHWDSEEREFRGFGLVEQRDTERFARYAASTAAGSNGSPRVAEDRYSPPLLTRTWFHQGEVRDAAGRVSDSTPTGTWSVDPARLPAHLQAGLGAISEAAAQAGEPKRRRDALRALRGSVMRTELFALDGSAEQDRPYAVAESLFDVHEIEDGGSPARAYFPHQVATRTTRWDRGAEPMVQVSFLGGYNGYGLPELSVTIGVPRGRDPFAPADVSAPRYLATFSTTRYATRDDAVRYIVDRAAIASQYEVLEDSGADVFTLRQALLENRAALRRISHALSYYDGPAFEGLAIGEIGDFGAVTRSENLAFQDEFIAPLFPGAPPTYLSTGPASFSPTTYPQEFIGALPPLAGYVHRTPAPDLPGGYYIAAQRTRYDFHDPQRRARGLKLEMLDPAGARAVIAYDEHELLPVRVEDAVGLTTTADYDYRVLKPVRITDPNGNIADFRFSPVGLLSAQFARGRDGEGDVNAPSLSLSYDLNAFVERGAPISVRTTRRVAHDSEAVSAGAMAQRVIETVEYSDGVGRLVQSRTQADDVLFGDPVFGGSGLAPDPDAAPAPAIGRAETTNVIVSGWQTYDNKGRVIEKYEPFFSTGWDYAAPQDRELGRKAQLFYDARGVVVRTLNPDGSELRAIPGVPLDVSDPDRFTPTPWESFAYDANDNAGRTHAADAAAYARHWNTPSSVEIDALGRTVRAIARNGPDAGDMIETRSSYDIQGNLIAVTDALGRAAFAYVYDLLGRRWRVDSIDAGRRDSVFDALGNIIEARAANGGLSLHAFDVLNRPIGVWNRDSGDGAIGLRHRLDYGDASRDAQPAAARAAARSLNLLGQLARQHDEAGVAVVGARDFKGNVLEQSRRVIADAPVLAAIDAGASAGWRVPAFETDWGGGPSLAEREAALLEPQAYETSTRYDALNRITHLTAPLDVEGRRRVLTPKYNSAGALERVDVDGETFVERIAYDAKGQRTLIAYGNGVMTRYAYDPDTFRLARMVSERYSREGASYVPSGPPLQDLSYSYDLAGNILAIHDRTPKSGVINNPDAAGAPTPALAQLLASGEALTRRFAYDPIYRLVSATGRECDRPPQGEYWQDTPRCADKTRTRLYKEEYRYDAVGNLLELAHRNDTETFVRRFNVETGSNRLTALRVGGTATPYAYDANGNMRREGVARHFEWGTSDELKAFRVQTEGAEPSVYALYLYDAAGQRVKKLVRKQGGRVEATHYLGGLFEHRRWSGGANNTMHVMDDRARIALVRIGPAEGGDNLPTVQYQLADHLGSANVVLDAAGALVNREEFTPYGETSFGTYAKKRYRFTGMERDEESGLSYHSARYYLSWAARWLSCDPLGDVDGPNLYAYSGCSPIQLRDISGTEVFPPPTAPGVAQTAVNNFLNQLGVRAATGAAATSGAATTASASSALPMAAPSAAPMSAAGVSTTLAAGLVGIVAMGATILGAGGFRFIRSNNIAQYGNPWGVAEPGMGILRHARTWNSMPANSPPATAPPVTGPPVTGPPAPAPAPTAPAPAPSQPTQRRQGPLELVNLDTSAMIAATQYSDTWLFIATHMVLDNKQLVAAQSAYDEFLRGNPTKGTQGVVAHAGIAEKIVIGIFLLRVQVIPDIPSARVVNLPNTSAKDKKDLGPIDRIAFGTGDTLKIRTVTADEKFVKRAAHYGVHLGVIIIGKPRYAGK